MNFVKCKYVAGSYDGAGANVANSPDTVNQEAAFHTFIITACLSSLNTAKLVINWQI